MGLAIDDDSSVAKHEEIVTSQSPRIRPSDQEKLPLGKALRLYPKVALYTSFVTLAILLWGYDLVIVGTVSSIPAFQ